MKILHVYKSHLPYDLGGVSEVIHQLCMAGPKFGYESDVFSFSAGPSHNLRMESYNTFFCSTNIKIASTPFSFTAFSMYRKMVEKYDLIHFHYPFPFGDLLHLTMSKYKRSIVTYHSDIIKQKHLKKVYFPIEQNFLSKVSKIIGTSYAYQNSSENLKKYRDKVVVVPLGLSDFSKSKNFNIQANFKDCIIPKKFFLFLGGLRNYKGVEELINAAPLSGQNIVFAGGGGDLDNWKKYILKKDILNVTMLGSVDDSQKKFLLSECLGVVMPSTSRTEAFGLSLVEGAMHSKPLISTNLGTGTSYVNIHRNTGLVVSPGSVEELAMAIKKIGNSSELREKYGKAARLRFERLFTADKMCESYAQIYKEFK